MQKFKMELITNMKNKDKTKRRQKTMMAEVMPTRKLKRFREEMRACGQENEEATNIATA